MALLTPPTQPEGPALDADIFSGLLELADDDDSFVVDLFESYVASYAKCSRGLREALAQGDVNAFRHHAHTLKGSSGNVGAAHLSALACELQDRADRGDIEGTEPWIEAIECEFERVMDAVCARVPSLARSR